MAFITIEFLSEVLGRQTSIDVIIPQKRTSGEIGIANNAKAEKYKTLVVRVAGYSALFTTLSRSLQDDIINRTEQGF